MEKCRCEGACIPCDKHKPIPSNITTEHGLIYLDGKQLNCIDGDTLARKYGFMYIENLVRKLEENK